MITVISGTNRQHSGALLFARHYAAVLATKTPLPVRLLELENEPHDWFHPQMYEREHLSPSLLRMQDDYILPAEKMVFVVPEYNGSFPGMLKLFLDAVSVRDYKTTFAGKKAAIVGVATGRAGNLRGMDHLVSVLHYLGMVVLPQLLPVSSIKTLLDETGHVTDGVTLQLLEKQMDSFLAF